MVSDRRRHATLLFTLLLIVGGLVTAEFFSNASSIPMPLRPNAIASAPPTPRSPVVLWSDDFENFPQPGSAPNGGQNGVQPMALNYGGVKYTSATGTTYTGDSQWLNITGCNGIVLSGQAASAAWPDSNGCENSSGSLDNLRKMAQAVGSVNGTGSATNHIVAAYTNRGFNTPGVEAQTEQSITFSSVAANRYFTASVWATAVNCDAVKPRLTFEYSTNGTTWMPFGSTYIDPCSLTNVANQTNFPGINVAKGFANSGIMLPVSSTQMYLRVKNVQANTGGGNDGGWDDLTLYEATPAISKAFNPTSIDKSANPSAVSTLTFTVTNTTDKSAKQGWEITDTLPTGLTIASSTTGGTCTPKTFTDGAGGSLGSGDTSVKIVGTIPYNVSSCTVTVQVTGTTDGTFTNILDPTDPKYSASNVKGLLPQGSASLTITAATPSTVALTYDCNGGTGSTAGTTVSPGTSVTVAAGSGCTRAGATFLGWSTTPNGSGTSAAAGSSLTLNADTTLYAVWSPPTATNDSYSTPYETPKTVPANAGVLTNDNGSGITVTANTQPPNGTVALNPDGSFTYTPKPGFSGQDCWNYTITENGGAATATAQSCVTVGTPGLTLVAANDSYSTPYETPKTVPANAGVLTNDSGSGITVTANTQPPNGTVALNPDGSFTYTPKPGFSGQDCWNYTITGNASQTATAQSCVTVGSPAPAPSGSAPPAPSDSPTVVPPGPDAVNDAATTMLNTPVSVNAAANDTYPAGSVFAQTSNPANGSVAWNSNGSYTYTPSPGFTGVDTFTYKVCMPSPNQTRCASATETITVGEPAPKASPQSKRIGPGSTQPVLYAPVGLSTPATGSNLKLGSVSIAQWGSGGWGNRLVVPGKGTWVLTGTQVQFEPAPGFTGQSTIRYRIQDRNGKWAYSTLSAIAPAIPTGINGGL